MFKRLKFLIVQTYLDAMNIWNGFYQIKPCTYYQKKYFFNIKKCECGNDWCKNEAICVCNECNEKLENSL